jgi:hypothetical protein
MKVLLASFEPRRDRTLAGWRFVRKPTRHASSRQFESQPTKTRGRYAHTLNAQPDRTIRQLWRSCLESEGQVRWMAAGALGSGLPRGTLP